MADEQSKSRELDGKRNARDLTVKVDVDVSDALTGLKALTREAKAATAALKEARTTAERLKALLADVTEENRHADVEEAIDYIRRSYE